VNQLEGITGNVLRGDGAPTFIFCSVRDDSTGTLDDPSSAFRLSCLGADGCTTTAEECARSGWTSISDDVSIPASFFLPPAGLPATPQSDPDIFVIGRTSDPPSYETSDYTTSATSADMARTAAACTEGGQCFANRVGSCTGVRGHLVGTSAGCRCRIDDLDAACIACGSGATGQCGGDCEFPLGDSTVRGICLPTSSDNPGCACYGIGAGSTLSVESCAGPLDGQCPAGRCCTDDPSDGCNGGPAGCVGLCVAGSCTADDASCGICFATGGAQPTPRPTPSDEPTPGGTNSPKPTPSAGPTAKPTSTPKQTATPAATPTTVPTASPKPSGTPVSTATPDETPSATQTPTPTPSPTPTSTPTVAPTATPTPNPTPTPPNTCSNGMFDGDETDIDCGGPTCPGCQLNYECNVNSDCAGGLFCVTGAGVCGLTQTIGCSDGLVDQGETDVDCGGTQCPHTCASGKQCTSDNDCQPGLNCVGSFPATCAPPPSTCSNGIVDGDETDIDCGGPTCPACQLDYDCNVNSDCASGLFCVTGAGVCGLTQTIGCSDGLFDQGESDVDCGGTQCPHTCASGKTCNSDNDCQPGLTCGGSATCG
jgi:hypothetical protein